MASSFKKVRIGIDIGGVITAGLRERENDDGTYKNTPPKDGCLEVIADLCKKYGAENVFIISKACNERRRQANLAWLVNNRFYETTGMPPKNVTVYNGPREQKAKIARELGVNVMIDDRLQCLVAFDPDVVCIAFNAKDRDEYLAAYDERKMAGEVRSWSGVRLALLFETC